MLKPLDGWSFPLFHRVLFQIAFARFELIENLINELRVPSSEGWAVSSVENIELCVYLELILSIGQRLLPFLVFLPLQIGFGVVVGLKDLIHLLMDHFPVGSVRVVLVINRFTLLKCRGRYLVQLCLILYFLRISLSNTWQLRVVQFSWSLLSKGIFNRVKRVIAIFEDRFFRI